MPGAGVQLIAREISRFGLNGLITIQENKTNRIARKFADEKFRVVEHCSNAFMEFLHIDRSFGRKRAKLLAREAAMAGDLGEHFFRRKTRETANRSSNDRA